MCSKHFSFMLLQRNSHWNVHLFIILFLLVWAYFCHELVAFFMWICPCVCSKYCISILFQNISKLHRFLFFVNTNQIKNWTKLNLAATHCKKFVLIYKISFLFFFLDFYCPNLMGVLYMDNCSTKFVFWLHAQLSWWIPFFLGNTSPGLRVLIKV